nr:MAG: RNA-dependent RNA polymerase [Riboviria sp.]
MFDYECRPETLVVLRRAKGACQPLSWDDMTEEWKRNGTTPRVEGWGDESPEELERMNAEWRQAENAPLPFIPTPQTSVASSVIDEDLILFENAEIPAESENPKGALLMDGPLSLGEKDTVSQTPVLHPAPLDFSLMEQALLGLQLQLKQLSEAFTSTLSTPAAPTTTSKPPRHRKKSGSGRFIRSGIPSNTPGEKFSSQWKKATGNSYSRVSTGMPAPVSEPSRPTRPIKQPSGGMVRSVVILPTTSASSTSSPSGLRR